MGNLLLSTVQESLHGCLTDSDHTLRRAISLLRPKNEGQMQKVEMLLLASGRKFRPPDWEPDLTTSCCSLGGLSFIQEGSENLVTGKYKYKTSQMPYAI
jgi:hypothetical protein